MTVVVGVSPTTGSPNALWWAAREAALWRLPVRAVLAWRAPRAPAAPGGRPSPVTAGVAGTDHAGRAERALRAFVTTALGSDTDVECVAVRGTAVRALLAAAEGASLLVIGEPRPGRLGSLVSSLVALQVILRAPCPVVVMPAAGPRAGRGHPVTA